MTGWLCFLCPSAGEDFKKESEKKDKVAADKSAKADVQTKATVEGEKTDKVTPLTADKSGSVRSKRGVKGEGKPQQVCFFNFKMHVFFYFCLSGSITQLLVQILLL